ncbi:MATE family efflux transporter [Frigidibacter sp. ROC022]|uniref:MATE family efflux transporter n=1 Tax=Frigidibacter sp. ROC022 TaxID=2971796 RepID=UPI00215B75DE|nr:MATE family efflux transporter [Frigidibacter sp. ROC022]MCR8723030.1 MATE family efflux transporter [Frigidibacter sp. ROC022]
MTKASLSWRAHAAALLGLGVPIVGSYLAGFFIHVTDTVMLGWYGVNDLAAIVLAGTLWFLTFILGSGFGTALPAVVANARAQGDEAQVRRATRMAIWLTLGYGVLISPLFLFAEPLLLAIGQKPEVAALAADYLHIAGWSVVPFLLNNVLRSYLSALGQPSAVLVVTLVGFVVHVLINWVLIFGHWGAPELGIRGAAISTLISDTLILVLLLIYATRKFPQYDLLARFWRPDPQVMARIFALGWPISLQMVAEVGLFSAASVMMGWISAESLAAHGIALQLTSTTFMLHLGLSNAATIRAGQAAGLHDGRLLRDGALTAVALSALIAAVTIAVFLSIPGQLIGLFLDPADPAAPQVIAVGVGLVTMAALFQLADAGQAMAIGLLRGVQDTKVPMVIAAVGYWVIGLPVAYLLGFPAGWGGIGVWTGLLVGLSVVWLALAWRFWMGQARQVGEGTQGRPGPTAV